MKIPKCHICGKDKIMVWDGDVDDESTAFCPDEAYYICPHSEIHDQRPQLVFEHLPERVCKIVGMALKMTLGT